MTITLQQSIELFGAVFWLAGNHFLSARSSRSAWGFVAFLVSNVAWIWFSIVNAHWFLLAQYLGFSAYSVRGIWNWS